MLRGGVILCVLLCLSGAVASAAPLRDVRQTAKDAGYGDIANRVAEASRPTAFLRPGRSGMPAALGTSRLGGEPDLPVGVAWPQCKAKPQSFLAQIRVRDLPGADVELRRLGGVLLFFTYVEFEPGETEYGLWAGDCSAVLHARSGTALERATVPGVGVMRLKAVALRFASRPDVPDLALDSDHLMPPLQDLQPAGGWDKWNAFTEALHGKPFVETKLLGYPGAPNGGDQCWSRAERTKRTWRHLFTMGPDDEFGFEVADAGRLQLLISPADLRAGRFTHVCGVFDSA
jgi:Domain of unknown function (DUF1963)